MAVGASLLVYVWNISTQSLWSVNAHIHTYAQIVINVNLTLDTVLLHFVSYRMLLNFKMFIFTNETNPMLDLSTVFVFSVAVFVEYNRIIYYLRFGGRPKILCPCLFIWRNAYSTLCVCARVCLSLLPTGHDCCTTHPLHNCKTWNRF